MYELHLSKNLVEFPFYVALFFNAILFIPQSIKIIRKKNAEGVSLITFCGFLLIQFLTVLHGLIVKDYSLVFGYIASMLTTGLVIFAAVKYKKRQGSPVEINAESILAQLPGHVYWKDVNGTILGCNTNNWKDFGFSRYRDILGKTEYQYVSKGEADRLHLLDQEVIRDEKLKTSEEIAIKSDGLIVNYLSYKAPLRDNSGKVIGISGVSLDITATKQETLERFHLLENIISIMPAYVYWMDKNGTYLGCNDKEARAIGLTSRHDIIGKKNIDLPGFLVPKALDPINFKVMETGEPVTLEEPAVLDDGVEAILLSSKVPLRDTNNKIIGMVGISIDITDRKEQENALIKAKEEAELANKRKSQFIENMQHDIRTPFISIYGVVDMLAHAETDEEKKSALEEVSASAKALMNYCDEILDLSSVDSGTMPVASKCFAIKSLIDTIYNIEAVGARNKKLTLSVDYNENIPNVLLGDPYRLKRILINFISNAIKFTETGSVQLSVLIENQEPRTRSLILKFIIQDTGVGIPQDKKAIIYQNLTKLNKSNLGLYNGLGIGLYLAKKFIEELDGNVHLKTSVGVGSTFTIYLPFKIPLSDNIDPM